MGNYHAQFLGGVSYPIAKKKRSIDRVVDLRINNMGKFDFLNHFA